MSGHYYAVPYAVPMVVPGKGGQYPTYSQYSMSPPECDDSYSYSSASGGRSYSHGGFSGPSASYLGTSHDYDSNASASGIDFQDYMQDRFSHSFNPIPLDRSLAVQAQT